MNAWEMARKMIEISNEIEELVEKKKKAVNLRERELIDAEIDRKEIVFFEYKHNLERMNIN